MGFFHSTGTIGDTGGEDETGHYVYAYTVTQKKE